jgi:hypothetical protein
MSSTNAFEVQFLFYEGHAKRGLDRELFVQRTVSLFARRMKKMYLIGLPVGKK